MGLFTPKTKVQKIKQQKLQKQVKQRATVEMARATRKDASKGKGR